VPRQLALGRGQPLGIGPREGRHGRHELGARRQIRRDVERRAGRVGELARPGEPLNEVEMTNNRPTPDPVVPTAPRPIDIGSGDVLIAAITSCTNTSNPGVLLAAGLLAKKAVEKGLSVKPHIKTSLAPGSRVVTDYLTKAGLMPYLERLGFTLAAYGCTTCIGNSGDLAPEINEAITGKDLVCAAVLSGNRNFASHGS